MCEYFSGFSLFVQAVGIIGNIMSTLGTYYIYQIKKVLYDNSHQAFL